MKKKSLSNFIMITVLFIMFISGLKCFFIIEQIIPKYINCYQHLSMPMPSLTIFYFQTNYIIQHYPVNIAVFTSFVILICILLAIFVKNKTIPSLLFTITSLIFVFFISFFGRAMSLPLLEANKLRGEGIEVGAIKLEIEKGNYPFIQFEKMQNMKYHNQTRKDEKTLRNSSEIKLNQHNLITSLQDARQKDIETKGWKVLQEIATAMEMFRFDREKPKYPASINELTDAEPPFIEKGKIDGIKKYYDMQLIKSEVDTYKIIASPTYEGEKMKLRSIIVDQTGIVRTVE